MQRVYEPRDQARREDCSVGLIEVLEVAQRVQSPRAQGVDQTAQVVVSAEAKLALFASLVAEVSNRLRNFVIEYAALKRNKAQRGSTLSSGRGAYEEQQENTWPAWWSSHFGQRK